MVIEPYLIPVIAIATIVWLVIKSNEKAEKYPPGPVGVPLLGYVPFLGPPNRIHEKFVELGKEYGNVFCVSMATTPVVILNDYAAVNQALVHQADVFSGRPSGVILEAIFERKDIASADGPIWKEQRHFALSRIRNFGFGNTSCQSIVVDEAAKLVESISKCSGQSVDVSTLFFTPLANYVWNMCAGKRFESTDPQVKIFGKAFYDLMAGMGSGGAINFFPWLRSLPFGGCGFQNIMQHAETVMTYLRHQVDEHAKSLHPDYDRDFIDQHLKENQLKNGVIPYNDEHVVGTLFDLFLGSIQTTDATLRWGLLLMAYHPHVQKKVHQELDEIVGPDAVPLMEMKPRLSYTEATLLEVMRLQTVTPLAVPHATTADTVLFGHPIPKGTMVLPNLWAVHHDPKVWGDPEQFRPERFLDTDGLVQHPEYLLPFSTGPRSCLGGPVARLQAFLMFSSLLHKLKVDFVNGEPKPGLHDTIPGLVLLPKPFNLKITVRS